MRLTDTHCHLYLRDFKNDLNEVIERARNAGVQRFYLPCIDSNVIDDMLKLEALSPKEFIPMMGLHPCSVKENYKHEIDIIEKNLRERKFVAIGEIGLDFYWDATYKNEQLTALHHQMELALTYNIPIVIHTRNAMKETIDAVKPFAAKGVRGIFHCFGDSLEVANEIIEMNFLLGIGGVITYKKSGLAETLKHVSLKHIVLETDAPYLTPVPYRGKRNESSYLKHIAEKLAEVKSISVEEVAEATTANAQKIFGQ